MPVTRVEPSNKLFDPARTFRYTNAANTDLAKRFKAMQVKAKAEARAKGQTELDARQQLLELPYYHPTLEELLQSALKDVARQVKG